MTPSSPAPGPTPQIRGIEMTVERCIQFCSQYRETVAEIRGSGKRPEIAEHDIEFIELVGEYLSTLASTPQGVGAVAYADFTEHGRIRFWQHGKEACKPYEDASGRICQPVYLHASPSSPNVGGYDEAVADLAKYLPDGWVAQDSRGETSSFGTGYEPEIAKGRFRVKALGGWGFGRTIVLRVPCATDWRTSLRRIVSGRVVNGGEG